MAKVAVAARPVATPLTAIEVSVGAGGTPTHALVELPLELLTFVVALETPERQELQELMVTPAQRVTQALLLQDYQKRFRAGTGVTLGPQGLGVRAELVAGARLRGLLLISAQINGTPGLALEAVTVAALAVV